MANKKLQYPSVFKVIRIPVAYPVVPGGNFCDFDLILKPKPIQLGSFNNLVVTPTPYPVVIGGNYADWEVALRKKPPQDGFIANTGLPTVVVTVFTPFVDWESPARSKLPSEGFVANTTLPPSPVIIVAGGFQDWDPSLRTKTIQEGFVTSVEQQPVQTFVFSSFSQPVVKATQQNSFLNTPFVIPVVVGPTAFTGFSDFGIPTITKVAFQDVTNSLATQQQAPIISSSVAFSGFPFSFHNKLFYQAKGFIPPPPVVVQPYVFSAFEQPQFRRPQVVFPDVTNITLPQAATTTTVYIFSSFDQAQLSSRIFHQAGHFIFPVVQAVAVQPYIFSTFEQPQFKKQIYDQPTWFNSTTVLQPYVFSSFSQPFNVRFQVFPQSVQFELLSISNPIPPVFTGFNDFGLAQQLVGTQRKQDGAYVQFRVLPPVFVPSVFTITDFSDFVIITPNTTFKVEQQPPVTNLISIPPPIPLEAAFAGRRWKYQETKKTPEDKKKIKVLPLKSSNLAAMSYDEDKKELRVTFKTYKYENVSKKKVDNLSHGEYFQRHIKAKHPTTKV